MTTLLLPPEEIAEIRVMKGLAYLLAVMIRLDRRYPGRAFTPEQVALVAGIDKRTAGSQLQDLSMLDRVILSSSGYVLTQGGRAMFLSASNDLALSSPVSNTAGTLTAQALQSPVSLICAGTEIIDVENTHGACASNSLLKKREEEDSVDSKNSSSPDSSEKSTKNAHALRVGNEITQTLKNLKVGENAIVPQITGYMFEDGTPVYTMARSDGSIITTREILEATEVIEWFGDFAPGLPVDAIKPELALAWIAKGCDDREKLSNAPAGLVYSRLRNVEKPRPARKYFKNPLQYLPDEYCELLRLEKYDCKSCVDAKFSTRAALDEHVQKMHMLPEPKEQPSEGALMDALDRDHPGSKAWDKVLAELQMEMPRASFDTWVRDTKAVDYDGTVLTVAARNAYCRDWLESRIEDTVSRLLSENLHQAVTVCFVVAEVGDG